MVNLKLMTQYVQLITREKVENKLTISLVNYVKVTYKVFLKIDRWQWSSGGLNYVLGSVQIVHINVNGVIFCFFLVHIFGIIKKISLTF